MIKVFRVLVGDELRLVALNAPIQQLHAARHPELFKQVTSPEEEKGFFREKLGDEKQHFWIAALGEQDVGYVWAMVHESAENCFKYRQRQLYVHHISVNPMYQRRGVGRLLFETLERLAKEHECSVVSLETWAFNKEAQSFFVSMGFQPRALSFWRKV